MTRWNYSSTGDEVVEAFKERVAGKTIVITGAGVGGIGAETAITLAKASPCLPILAGRNESKISPVVSEINAKYPDVKVRFTALDLESQRSVRKAASQIKEIVKRIDILINNAGIMACPYSKNEDGIETQFATNYLGHFLLTNLLVEKVLAAGKGARIVNVSTSTVFGKARLDDVNWKDGVEYDPWLAYHASKIAIVISTRALARKLGGKEIFSFSLHPGSIASGLQIHMNSDPDGRAKAAALAKSQAASEGREFKFEPPKSLQQGTATTIVAALDPELEQVNGAYLWNGNPELYQPQTSVEDQQKLWALSERLVGERFDLQSKV